MGVPDEGSLDAKLVLVGEAPGGREMEAGRPFFGPSFTQKLKLWWDAVGLKREDFYITNVLDYQPVSVDRVPRAELEDRFDALHVRIGKLDDPLIIVPTGNYALYALTGKGRISWHTRDGYHNRPGITSHRGSIYEYFDQRGRRIKVIGTIHPAATFRTPSYERACRADWARIAAESRFRELRLPQRVHRIRPSLSELLDFAQRVHDGARELSIDIETPRRVRTETTFKETSTCECKHHVNKHEYGRCQVKKCECCCYIAKKGKPKRQRIVEDAYIGCVGFAFTEDESLTVPLGVEYWGSEEDAQTAFDTVKRLCELPVPKVLQNGLFDAYWLASAGIQLKNFRWDTRLMHHAIEPTDSHDLAYLASVYTRQPYWKDEAKDPDEVAKYANNSDALWTYNGIDCAVTLEIYRRLREELESRNLLPFYNRHYADLLAPLLALSLHGIAVDHVKRKSKFAELAHEAASIQSEIEALAGFPLHASKGLSNERLKFFLYGPSAVKEAFASKLLEKHPDAKSLRLPKHFAKNAKKEKVVSTGEVAVRRLALRFPDKLGKMAELILAFRRRKQLSTFLKEDVLDKDGRMRCSYGWAETGRLTSQATPQRTGRNLQNIDRELRDCFVPG